MPHRHALQRTFIDPFRHWRRSAVFLGTFAGYFGFTLVNVASAYGLGGNGLWSLLAYFGPSMLLPGFILWPLLYCGFRAFDGPQLRCFILLAQIAAFGAYLILPKEPLIQGIAGGFIAAPFWSAYHIAMVQNTTNENRAFEVSLAMFLGITGSITATILCGVLLDHGMNNLTISIAFAALFIGTLAVMLAMQMRTNAAATVFISEARAVIRDNPYLVRRIITQSLFDMPGFTLAAFMNILHFSASMTSLLLASRIVSEFLLAPAVGHFVHTRRNQGFGVGMVIVGVAWLFILAAPKSSITLIIFVVAYGAGTRFAFNSLISGLYEMQRYASMMWTEVFLAVGRVIGMIALMPLLYYSVNLYMLELAVLAGVLVVLNRIWMRRWKT